MNGAMNEIKETLSSRDSWSQVRASLPAGSRARKQWDPEEEILLLQLRQQNPRVSWERMQPIFNSCVHPDRHRTPDALACKYKTIRPKDDPMQSIRPSQNNIASELYPQQGQIASTFSGTVSCSASPSLTCHLTGSKARACQRGPLCDGLGDRHLDVGGA